MRKIVLILLLITSCVLKPAYMPQVPTMPRVAVTLPPSPATIPLSPEITQGGAWVEPLESGQCILPNGQLAPSAPHPCPSKSGILSSEESASRAYLYKISYEEIRKLYESDSKLWNSEKDVYDATVKELQTQIEKQKPTWLQQNGLTVGFAGGFVLGVAAVVATSIAITK